MQNAPAKEIDELTRSVNLYNTLDLQERLFSLEHLLSNNQLIAR
jgi:hypothetical protein